VPLVGWIVGILTSLVLGLGGFILWICLMWQAFQGKEWELPVIGAFARKQLAGTMCSDAASGQRRNDKPRRPTWAAAVCTMRRQGFR
jgi:hypothetical protein